MAARKVRLLSPGMRDLLNAPGVRAELQRRADAVAAAAKASAPVASGAYRDSIRVESVTTDRAVARVVAGTDHGLLVESKTGNLARALGAGGA